LDIQDPAARTDRQCGKCSLCCKLLHVVELDKPANQWCGHCKPGKGGCTIHETRPHICRSYFCGWMLSENVGPEWYPLHCHMILSLGKFNNIQTVTVTVDPRFPWMWKEQPYYAQLKQMSHRGLHVKDAADILLVHVRVDDRVWLLVPNDDIEITACSYIVKLTGPSQWEVEQFATQEQAAVRVAELT
jgi:Fe-S-cluster containining protein